ncbi:RagB/SusD family nutrient uptake outer membrane protein [Chitinophaga japonensis]|uniref:Putative outer membrane starch-binding protein n=1 Tax=Chitinophaga japonensis TaxID=104662 RepID=A0A562STA5_CHIJA|nr:RagB/SusD family nutrient uptake outer membrane protein [Chitinophaga japonensis]TWI84373.1 putative outer membrane starch-binding protein [Chitinophaga japonensis]
MNKHKLFGLQLYFSTYVMIVVVILFTSCRKFIEVDSPANSINEGNVYTNDATAASVVTGIYQTMSRENSDEFNATGKLANIYTGLGLSADELILFDINSMSLNPYYTNDLAATSAPGYWRNIYNTIYIANAVMEGIESSTSLTPAVKKQLLGEAKFLRAFNYFYLVNLYGDVPLALSTDYTVNTALPRFSEQQVYDQIIRDLEEAKTLLSSQYLQGDAMTAYANGAEERVRPTNWSATALLARVLLYTKDYANAEKAATEVINQTSLYNLETLDNAFLKNNREAIWQLQPVNNGIYANTGEAKFFILPEAGPGSANPVYLREELVNSFETGDLRKIHWVGQVPVGNIVYHYPYKYKIGLVNAESTEYTTILRLAELYLIRAEARTYQGNLNGAVEDLNIIRNRAGLPNIIAASQSALIDIISHERRVELFTEWGHRWLDLKRTGEADWELGIVKGANWQTTDQLYPIPDEELRKSPDLQQNPGY